MTSAEKETTLKELEANLWETADSLRNESSLTSQMYYMPVLGIIFLRHVRLVRRFCRGSGRQRQSGAQVLQRLEHHRESEKGDIGALLAELQQTIGDHIVNATKQVGNKLGTVEIDISKLDYSRLEKKVSEYRYKKPRRQSARRYGIRPSRCSRTT